jgi:hypothetical protein
LRAAAFDVAYDQLAFTTFASEQSTQVTKVGRQQMKAFVAEKYGPPEVLRMAEVEKWLRRFRPTPLIGEF